MNFRQESKRSFVLFEAWKPLAWTEEQRWVLQSHRLFGDSRGEVEGGDLSEHLIFCGALCSVTVPNETPRSSGSALLIWGSGHLLGDRTVWRPCLELPPPQSLFPSHPQLPGKLLIAYWPRRYTGMFLLVRSGDSGLKCRDDLSFLWSPTPDSTGQMKKSSVE